LAWFTSKQPKAQLQVSRHWRPQNQRTCKKRGNKDQRRHLIREQSLMTSKWKKRRAMKTKVAKVVSN
jgi:hypothetical protein